MGELEHKLIDFHSALFSYWRTSAPHLSTLPVLYPVHGGTNYMNVQFPGPSLDANSFPSELQARLHTILEEIMQKKGVGLDRLKLAVVGSFHEAYIRGHLQSPFMGVNVGLDLEARQNSRQIALWVCDSGCETEFQIDLMPIPNLVGAAQIGPWKPVHHDWISASREVHWSQQSGQEGLTRIVTSQRFARKVDPRDTLENLVLEAENLTLALSLGCRQPFLLEQAKSVRVPWAFAPGNFSFNIPIGPTPNWSSPRLASMVQFTAGCFLDENTRKLGEVDPEALLRSNHWFTALQQHLGLAYSLKLVVRGLWLTFGSHQESWIRQRSTALDGIHNLLVGLEGLNSACKSKKNGPPGTIFKNVWTSVWKQAKSKEVSPFFSKVIDIEESLKSFWDLRNALAHGDPRQINELLRRVKVGLGDFLNPGSYDAINVGQSIACIIFGLLEVLRLNQNLVSALDSGDLSVFQLESN